MLGNYRVAAQLVASRVALIATVSPMNCFDVSGSDSEEWRVLELEIGMIYVWFLKAARVLAVNGWQLRVS
jgi:hypothetical protein